MQSVPCERIMQEKEDIIVRVSILVSSGPCREDYSFYCDWTNGSAILDMYECEMYITYNPIESLCCQGWGRCVHMGPCHTNSFVL